MKRAAHPIEPSIESYLSERLKSSGAFVVSLCLVCYVL